VQKNARYGSAFGDAFLKYASILLAAVTTTFIVLIITTVLGSKPVAAVQTVPYKLNFQGRLTDTTGNIKPDGLYNMRIRVYDAATNGNLLGMETRDGSFRVQVTNGLFSIQIGDNSSLNPSLFTQYPLYLEVELPTPATATCTTAGCGTWTEGPMTPRSPLGSSPYAMNADTVDGIDGINLARTDTSNTFNGTSNQFNGFLQVAQSSEILFNLNTNFTIQNAGTAGWIAANTTGSLDIGVTPYQFAGEGANLTNAVVTSYTSNSYGIRSAVEMGVTDGDNLVSNPGFEFGCTGWAGCFSTNTSAPASGNFNHRIVQSSNTTAVDTNSRYIAVREGEVYFVSMKYKTSSVTNGQGGFYLKYFNSQNTVVGYSSNDWSNPGTSYVTRSASIQIPAGVQYVTFGMTVRGDGSTGGTWDFDDIYVTKASSANAQLYKNATNSATAFQIQNASGSQLFVADTSTNTIKIGNGNISPDASPTLIVLDHKSTGGDPANGVNGAMYYNVSSSKFRCYEGGTWKDCITATGSRSTFSYVNDFGGLPKTTTNPFIIDANLAYMFVTAGFLNNTLAPVEANRPGIARLDNSNSGSAIVGLISATASPFSSIMFGGGTTWSWSNAVKVPAVSNSTQGFIVRSGFLNTLSTSTAPTAGCFFAFTHTVNSGKVQGNCVNGGTSDTCDTGFTPTADGWMQLNLVVNPSGTSATFTVNDSSLCTIATAAAIPTSTGTGYGTTLQKTVGTTARFLDIDYIDVKGFGINR
jgi:hypothetical protein